MENAGFRWTWAVSMDITGAYEPKPYIAACQSVSELVKFYPVAFLPVGDFTSESALSDWMEDRKAMGFRAVKMHPRLGRFNFENAMLPVAIDAANAAGLTPLLCTYFHSSDPMCATLSANTLKSLLYKTAGRKLVLLHGGGTQLLDVSEMTRPFKTTMLDLSFTLLEYAGSSLDLDLAYVLNRCRDRVCIGTDSPEFKHQRVRDRFEELTAAFEQEHSERIAYRNIFRFADLPESDML